MKKTLRRMSPNVTMALEDSLIILRHLIDDTDSTVYSDERLIELLYISAIYVNMDVGASYSVNTCSQTISPTPDSSFSTLTALKAACLLVRSTQKTSAQNEFTVTDGPATVNLKGIAANLKTSADGFCNQYDRAKMGYLMGNTNWGGGYAISTPNSDC